MDLVGHRAWKQEETGCAPELVSSRRSTAVVLKGAPASHIVRLSAAAAVLLLTALAFCAMTQSNQVGCADADTDDPDPDPDHHAYT